MWFDAAGNNDNANANFISGVVSVWRASPGALFRGSSRAGGRRAQPQRNGQAHRFGSGSGHARNRNARHNWKLEDLRRSLPLVVSLTNACSLRLRPRNAQVLKLSYLLPSIVWTALPLISWAAYWYVVSLNRRLRPRLPCHLLFGALD